MQKRSYRPGYKPVIVEVDFKELEKRIAQNINKDPHIETAKLLFGDGPITDDQRKLAKAINFGVMYNHE